MRVLIADPIAPEAVDGLAESHDVVVGFESSSPLFELVSDREAVILRSGVKLTADVLAAAPDLKLVLRAGSGLDNIDLDSAAARGIRVARVPGASPDAVAELSIGLMLAATRHISRADALVRQGRWPKHQLGGRLIGGKTMGIVGAGRIGSRTGAKCAALGMDVLGCVEHPGSHVVERLASAGIRLCDFDTVISESDYVSIHTPLQESTRGLIDAVAIGKMKPGSVLVNTSRGGVVDEAAVYEALVSEHLSAAAFDVHLQEGEGVIPELAQLPNVVLTPHIGGMALETQRWIGERVIELLTAYQAGKLDDVLTPEESVL